MTHAPPPGSRETSADDPERPEPELEEAFDRLVEEGDQRLKRPLVAMVSTGLLGGIDVGFGVLAFLVVMDETGNQLLAGLAFSLGLVALLLAGSELFTENFLVPVTAVVAGRGGLGLLARLWAVSAVTNLAGGWVLMWLVLTARPDLGPVAVETATHYADLGASGESFTLAVLAGAALTLMTRMQKATESLGVQLVPAVFMGTLLAGAQLFHCVLDSLFMFAALVHGAPFGYATWLGAFAWAALGNAVGGIGLVTALRLLRVPRRVLEQREQGSAT